jgi:eukaryotic-like serine/threonine-protein kinase
MTTLSPGVQLSRYRIVSRIGAGGMGEVWKAHDPVLDRNIALKILPERLVTNADRLRRFEQEARAASGLSHPHIITIHEIGSAGNGADQPVHFIAMELVEGRTLREALAAGMPLREVLEVLSNVADALAKAHGAGIVHRDLKPENIMITADGYGKVLDFGLAKLLESASDTAADSSATVEKHTSEGIILGTPAYMSPEQVRGQRIDHRSDVFSFGCVLYEAVTRRRPFEGDSKFDILHQIVSEEPRPLSEIAPNAPGELRRMIRRCMNKDPERRYQSMKDVAMELRDIVQEFDSISATRPVEMPLVRRRPWLIAASIALAAILLAAALFLRRPAAGEATSAFAGARLIQLTRSSGVESFPRISPDGNYIVYVSAASGSDDIYLQRLGGFNAINLTERSSARDSQPAISPDGRFIAFHSTRDEGGIFIMGATGESVRRLTGNCANPAWSPDGTKIACSTVSVRHNPLSKSGTAHLWIVDVATGSKKQLSDVDAVQPAWSPNGHRIAFWSNRGMGSQRDIFTVSSSGGEALPVLDDPPADWGPAWSPDGQHLYFSSDRGGTMGLWRIRVDERSGRALGKPEPLPTASRWNGPLDVSQDGKKIVFSSAEVRAEIYRQRIDPNTAKPVGAPVPVFHGITRAVDCAVSPDGQWLVFRSEAEQEDIFVVRTDGTELRQLTNDIHRDRGASWSPDGSRIAFYSDRGGGHHHDVWTVAADGSQLERVTRVDISTWFPRWSPDGKWMSAQNQTGSFLIDLEQPKPITTVQPLPRISPDQVFRAMAWSPDGQWLAGRLTDPHGGILPGSYVYSVLEKRYLRIGDHSITMVGWLPDSRRIVFSDVAAGALRIADRVTGETTDVGELPASEWTFGGLAVTADGQDIYYVRSAAEADIWMLAIE